MIQNTKLYWKSCLRKFHSHGSVSCPRHCLLVHPLCISLDMRVTCRHEYAYMCINTSHFPPLSHRMYVKDMSRGEVSEEETGFSFYVSKILLNYLYLYAQVWLWVPTEVRGLRLLKLGTCTLWPLSHLSGSCFSFLHETGSTVAQASLNLPIQLIMSLNSWSSCLYAWSTGMIATCRHIQLEKQF